MFDDATATLHGNFLGSFDLGGGQTFLILLIVLIFLAARRLPELTESPKRRVPIEWDLFVLFRAMVIILLVILVLSLLQK